MLAPDVNLLLYAHRADGPLFERHRAWLQELVASPQPFALSALIAVGFVRVATYPPQKPRPTPLDTALAFIDSLLRSSSCRLVAPGPSHWRLVSDLCRKTQATGKLVADAVKAKLAALG